MDINIHKVTNLTIDPRVDKRWIDIKIESLNYNRDTGQYDKVKNEITLFQSEVKGQEFEGIEYTDRQMELFANG
tara:strand:- start:1980 stop:2201 length:222 start_codon:yes stop_codon:yes gene_type:complete